MSLVAFIIVAAIGSTTGVLVRRWPTIASGVGIVALAIAFLVAAGIRSGDVAQLGGSSISGSDYARLFLALGAVTSLLLVLVALGSGPVGDLSAASLAALGVAAFVLGTNDLLQAAVAATAVGLVGVAISLGLPTVRSVGVAVRELRALAVAGALAIGALAWTSRLTQSAGVDPGVVGLAYLAGVVAIAVRFGAIPFHLWAARVADAVSETALPLVMAWGPAILAIVGLAWLDDWPATFGGQLGLERGAIVLVAALTVALAAIASTVHDDLEHVVGYGIITDAGFVILAFAALDPVSTEAARIYLVAYLLVKSAFGAWAASTRSVFGVRQVAELSGWARQSPPLALGLVLVLVAAVGIPGVAVWDARAELAFAALDGPLAVPFLVGGLAPLLYLGRLLVVGYGRTSAIVAAAPSPWPWRPASGPPRGARATVAWLSEIVRGNRGPLAAACTLALGALAIAVAAGAFGIQDAAAAAIDGAVR
jgi:NADH:ubiquinone oxidoreductase subunit 2 (subunit N)